jgi:hypothetical protein
MIKGYFGNVRQGKTASAVRDIYKLYLNGYKIYSNTWLKFPYTPLTLDFILDIVEKDLSLPDNCAFFLDEIYIFVDARISGSKRNRIVSYFLLQTGKLGNNTDFGMILIYTAQFPDQCDKRLRHVTDMATECEKLSYKGDKYFVNVTTYFKGSKTFTKAKVWKGSSDLYKLYDTRKKILVAKDRYTDE